MALTAARGDAALRRGAFDAVFTATLRPGFVEGGPEGPPLRATDFNPVFTAVFTAFLTGVFGARFEAAFRAGFDATRLVCLGVAFRRAATVFRAGLVRFDARAAEVRFRPAVDRDAVGRAGGRVRVDVFRVAVPADLARARPVVFAIRRDEAADVLPLVAVVRVEAFRFAIA